MSFALPLLGAAPELSKAAGKISENIPKTILASGAGILALILGINLQHNLEHWGIQKDSTTGRLSIVFRPHGLDVSRPGYDNFVPFGAPIITTLVHLLSRTDDIAIQFLQTLGSLFGNIQNTVQGLNPFNALQQFNPLRGLSQLPQLPFQTTSPMNPLFALQQLAQVPAATLQNLQNIPENILKLLTGGIV